MWTIEPRPLLSRELPTVPAALSRAPVVGAVWSSEEINARVKQIDADIEATNNAVDVDRKALLAKSAGGTPLTDDEKKRVAFMKDWNQFLFDWNDQKAQGISIAGSSVLDTYDAKQRALRKTWESLSGAPHPVTPPSPTPAEVDKLHPSAASTLLDAVKPLAWGVGLLGAGLILSSIVRTVKG
jgi:hypothetical protein